MIVESYLPKYAKFSLGDIQFFSNNKVILLEKNGTQCGDFITLNEQKNNQLSTREVQGSESAKGNNSATALSLEPRR